MEEETINYLSTETEITELNFDLLEQVDINILDIKQNYNGNIAKLLAEHAIKSGSYDNVTVSILFL